MNLFRLLLTTGITLAVTLPVCAAPAVSQYDRVVRLVKELPSSPRVRMVPFGKSLMGRRLPAYIISDFTIDSSSKTRVFICSGQHGNEISPMRSVLALSCRLASGSETELLRNCVFVVVPMVNPDGVAEATRLSGGGYDLNRGWRNSGTLESQYVNELIRIWRPHVLIDVHEQTTHIPAGGNFIETPHCLTPEQQAAVSSLASRISSDTGLRLATCGPGADKQLFHRNYACLGYGAYLLETSVDAPYTEKDRLYTSAILGLARAVSEDSALRSELSPSAGAFNVSEVRAYLRPLEMAGPYASASFVYGIVLLGSGYGLLVWLSRPGGRGQRSRWSRRYVRCEVDESLQTTALEARQVLTPITYRSWVRRRVRSRHKQVTPERKQQPAREEPQGIAAFITPRYSRLRTAPNAVPHPTQRA